MKKQNKILLSSAVALILLATLGTAAGWASSNGQLPLSSYTQSKESSLATQELDVQDDSPDTEQAVSNPEILSSTNTPTEFVEPIDNSSVDTQDDLYDDSYQNEQSDLYDDNDIEDHSDDSYEDVADDQYDDNYSEDQNDDHSRDSYEDVEDDQYDDHSEDSYEANHENESIHEVEHQTEMEND